MRRRNFLIFSSILGLSPYIDAKEMGSFKRKFKKVELLIEGVQAHMFPSDTKLPSASSMKTTQFLLDTITHRSYDKDIRAFILEGAEELADREKGRFLTMSHNEKEKALRAYEDTEYGSSWLGNIMTLTMEAMFSDPIYGSNINESGWRSLDTYGGLPRPKTRYMA